MKDKLEFPFYALPISLTARKDLQASDKVVFSVIRDYLDDNGTSWPGIRTLSRHTGLSLSTVVESVRRLEAKKVLKVRRQRRGKSNHYSITKSALKSEQSVTKAHRKPNTGVLKTSTEAYRKSEPNQKDLLNQSTTSNSFSFVLRSKKLWHLPQDKLNEYKQTFSNLNVEYQLRKAAQWLIDNPRKRKTDLGMERFLNGWLNRAKPDMNCEQYFTHEATEEEIEQLTAEGVL